VGEYWGIVVPELDSGGRSAKAILLKPRVLIQRTCLARGMPQNLEMDKKRILIVDDNKVQTTALASKLRAAGFEVLVAADGSDAISIARREKLDLIVLDILFPPDVAHGGGVGWDGFLILTWIRRVEEAKHVPVIFVTGADPAKYEKRALAEGALGFFRKPIDNEQLIASMRGILGTGDAAGSSKKRVLFVDDESDWRFVAGTSLQQAGFEVVTAKDAAETLLRLETLQLDGIVLDMNLGVDNGLLLMELLKQKHPGVPILIYTGMTHDPGTVQAILNQGASQYLRKGTMAELCDALKKMLN
jgi:CheY-like chemotaxis protein